jgi:ectoine hydroxylase-related dioxygenase (phytanoyl-CoA dioxygenase family)
MLSQEQVDTLHRDGFLVIRGLFSGEELRLLQEESKKVETQGIELSQSISVDEQKNKSVDDHVFRKVDREMRYFRSEKMWNRHPIFKAVTVKPELLQAIGQCVGAPFAPGKDSFVCKTPRSMVPILWHQDPPYWDPCRELTFETPNFDVDIYLHPSTVENGCVYGIPGHHLVGHVDMKDKTEDELFDDYGAVPIEMQPGDVLFHCLSAPHGSRGNPTGDTRSIFYVHFASKDVAEDGYPGWGDYDHMVKGMAEMSEIRASMGFNVASLEDHELQFSDKGVEYLGQINTPPHYWGTLISAMSESEIEQKKSLTYPIAQG